MKDGLRAKQGGSGNGGSPRNGMEWNGSAEGQTGGNVSFPPVSSFLLFFLFVLPFFPLLPSAFPYFITPIKFVLVGMEGRVHVVEVCLSACLVCPVTNLNGAAVACRCVRGGRLEKDGKGVVTLFPLFSVLFVLPLLPPPE